MGRSDVDTLWRAMKRSVRRWADSEPADSPFVSATLHPIDRLFAAIADPVTQSPRTAKLMREGVPKMAKKVAEEAVEVSLDAVTGERQRVVEESVDLLYNLAVLWAGLGLKPADIWAEMDRRERLLGLAEKLPKPMSRSRGAGEP